MKSIFYLDGPQILLLALSISKCLSTTLDVPGAGFSIPDNNGVGGSSSIIIAQQMLITDITVSIRGLNHGFAGDLSATLTHVESGRSQYLFSSIIYSSAYIYGDFHFKDAFPNYFTENPIEVIAPGHYHPSYISGFVSLLDVFQNTLAAGTWKLNIVDNSPGAAGMISSWGMTLELSLCGQGCSQCMNPPSTNCLLCNPNNYLLLNSDGTTYSCAENIAALSWADGPTTRFYYSSGPADGSGSAQKCSTPCVKCSLASTNCDSCEASFYLLTKTDSTKTCISSTNPSSLNQGADSVQRGFYFTGSADGSGIANKCNSPCVTCQGSSSNCVLCEANSYLLTKADSTKTCVGSTAPSSLNQGADGVQRGFYFTGSSDGSGTASKCESPCLRCQGSGSNCLSCAANSYLFTKGDGSKTCIGSGSPSSLNQGADGVIRGFYFTGSSDGTGVANKCISPCRECVSLGVCSRCLPNELLFCSASNFCSEYDQCVPAQYLNSPDESVPPRSFFTEDSSLKISEGTAVARLCPFQCGTCASERKCTSCRARDKF